MIKRILLSLGGTTYTPVAIKRAVQLENALKLKWQTNMIEHGNPCEKIIFSHKEVVDSRKSYLAALLCT